MRFRSLTGWSSRRKGPNRFALNCVGYLLSQNLRNVSERTRTKSIDQNGRKVMQVSVELVSHRDTNPQLALTATDTSFWLSLALPLSVSMSWNNSLCHRFSLVVHHEIRAIRFSGCACSLHRPCQVPRSGPVPRRPYLSTSNLMRVTRYTLPSVRSCMTIVPLEQIIHSRRANGGENWNQEPGFGKGKTLEEQ
jgi:hypothetical protein